MPFLNGVYSLPFRIGTNTPTEPQYSGQVGADFDDLANTITNESITNVKNYGATGDGGTDDTAAIQAAVDASGGGTIFFPKGGYLVSDAITCTEQVILLGEGQDKSIIFCAGNDCTLIDLSGRDSTIMQLGFNGSQDFGATNAAIIIRAGANNCHIENNFIQFGRYCILNLGTDNTFFNNEMRYAYGSALMKSVGSSGIFIFRNKMDQVWPDVIPADGYTVNAWASGTVYAQGDVVTTQGWRIQCTSAGTSGGSPPTLLGYEADIVDNTAEWQVASPSTFYSFQMDDGASEVFMNMNDHSGCFSSCIAMTATGDDGGSGDPFLLWVSNAIMGQQKDHSVFLAVGSECSVIQSEVNTGWGTGTGVNTESGWTGNIHITGNNFRGGGSGTGIKLYGQYSATQISLNSFDGTYSIGINVDDGGGTISDFTISENTFKSATSIVISSGVDWYIVTNNNTHGGGVSDGGAGANKTVTGNI